MQKEENQAPNQNQNQTLTQYIQDLEDNQQIKTARDYKDRLNLFRDYVSKAYGLTLDQLITTLTIISHGPKIDVYELLSKFIGFIRIERNVNNQTIKQYVSTVRTFLESNDVEISERKFRHKVRLPRIIRTDKEAFHKKDIQTILNACHNIKLKTYILFLAATGCRAEEALSIRLRDINFKTDPATVFIRGQFTKTKVSRTIMLTSELVQHLKQWLEYKHRTRSVSYTNKSTGKSYVEKRTPKVNNEFLLFSTKYRRDATVDGLYTNMLLRFESTLDRLGGKYAEREDSEKRRKYTLHSFRRFVKTTISNLGYESFSEYYLGHKGSDYYKTHEDEKINLFRTVEPHLTFLDTSSLERKGADQQTRIEYLESELSQIREALGEWHRYNKEHKKF